MNEKFAKFVVIGGGIAGVTCAETVTDHFYLPLGLSLSKLLLEIILIFD